MLEMHTECVAIKGSRETTVDLPSPKHSLTVRAHCVNRIVFWKSKLWALCTLCRPTWENHTSQVWCLHTLGCQRDLFVYLVLRGTLWTLNTAYKHRIRFTHVQVVFLATCVQSAFYSPSKAKHLHHNRRIWALPRDVWTCTQPNMCMTSKFTLDPLLDKMPWKFAAPDPKRWFWGPCWASARHLHGSRRSHSHLPEADLQNSTGVTTLFSLFQSENICFDFLELGLCQTT